MTTDPMLLLAATRSAELRSAAARHALVRIATCCRPSTAARALARVRTSFRALRTPCCA